MRSKTDALLQADNAAVSWAADEAGKIISVSHNVRQVTGFTAEEIRRTDAHWWLGCVHPEDVERVREGYRTLFNSDTLFDLEYRIRKKDGGVIEVRDRALALFVKEGVKRAEGLISDVGDRRRARAEREVLFEIIQGTNLTANLDELLQLIHQALKKVIFAENCFIALYNLRAGVFEFPFFADQYDPAPAPMRAEKTATDYVFRTGRPMIFTQDTYRDWVTRGEGTLVGTRSRCWMGVPISTPAETIGVLVVQSYDDDCAYNDRDLEFFASVGSQVALAIERKRAEQAVRRARDELELKVEERTAALAKANEGLHVEIAERQRTETALRITERRFSLAFHASPLPMALIRAKDGKYLDVNESFLRVGGYARGEVIGRTDLDLQLWPNPEDRDRFQRTFQERGSVHDLEISFRTKGGQVRCFLISAEQFDLEGEPHLLAVANDITERKQVEEALRDSESRYRLLFEDNPHPMWVYDLGTLAFLAVNDAAIRHYGYSRREFLGMTIKDIRPPEDVSTLMEDVCRARLDQNAPGVWRHLKKDGTPIDVEITAHTLKLPEERARLVLALDVTERKRAEAELREAQERIAGIISSAMDAIITVDAGQRVILFNAAAEQMFGCLAGEALGQSLDRFIPERFRSTHHKHIPAFGRTHDTRRRMGALGAIFGVRANGEEFPIEASISQVETGGRKFFTVILRDITERKRAEEALRESEDRFRTLAETASDAIITIDERSAIVFVNPAVEKVFGYGQDEILGADLTRLMPECLRHIHQGGLARYVQTGRNYISWEAIELTGRHRSGREIPLEISIGEFTSNGRRFFTGIVRDITERKRAEVALRQSEERFRLLVDGVEEYAICLLDPAGMVVSWNSGAQRTKGYRAEEIIGRHFSIFYTREDQEGGKPEEHLRLARETGKAEDEGWRVRKDGSRFYANMVITALRNDQGGLYGFAKVARDITKYKQAEEQIQQLNEELEQRVVQRTAQLEAANRELEAFSYTVSHDLRAPLRALAGFSRILREDYESNLPAEAQQHLQRVQKNAQQMGRLIDDLLAFSRLGRLALNKLLIAPAELAQAVLDELHDEREGRQVKIILGDLPVCRADPALLRQVFVNLLANALKFTRRREVAVIEIGCRCGGDGCPIYFVKDNGVGFDMQYIHKLFGVFQRLHRVEEYEGTGVGLAIVQRIINRHGGRIWAEAELGRGATFYFTLAEDANE